jgi:hypothetical protein
MLKKSILIIIICTSLTGCFSFHTKAQPLPNSINIPSADIVYVTIIDQRENLGFLSLTSNINQVIDIDGPIQSPIWVNVNILAALEKRGWMGSITDYTGSVFILSNKQDNMRCTDDYAFGGRIQPYDGNILISNSKYINLISSKDCSLISTLITEKDLLTIDDKPNISSFAITQDGKYIIIELGGGQIRLIRIKMDDKTFFDYQKMAINPSISPDNNLISYVGIDGIHITKFDGVEDWLVVPYEAEYQYGSSFSNDNSPYPVWSPDGKELLYHKCLQSFPGSCGKIEDYSIYTYNIEAKVETLLLDKGITPSWFPK